MITPSEQDIDLDLIQSRLIVVYANQYDLDVNTLDSNIINCHIYNNGIKYDLDDYDASDITFNLKRANGTNYTDTIRGMGGYISDNVITFPINTEMTTNYGRNIISFKLVNGDDVKYTCNFYMRVYKAPVQQGDEITESDYKDIDERYKETQEQIKLLANEYVTTNSTPPSGADDNDFWTEFLL